MWLRDRILQLVPAIFAPEKLINMNLRSFLAVLRVVSRFKSKQ
jgi:hypothetical protein